MMWIVVFEKKKKIAEELIFPRIYLWNYIKLLTRNNSEQLQQRAVNKSH